MRDRRQPGLFDSSKAPPAPDRPRPLTGCVELDGLEYRWQLHLDRIEDGWKEQRDPASGAWMPHGFAFGMLHKDPNGVWKPVKFRPRTWDGWAKVRKLEGVREALGDMHGDTR